MRAIRFATVLVAMMVRVGNGTAHVTPVDATNRPDLNAIAKFNDAIKKMQNCVDCQGNLRMQVDIQSLLHSATPIEVTIICNDRPDKDKATMIRTDPPERTTDWVFVIPGQPMLLGAPNRV